MAKSLSMDQLKQNSNAKSSGQPGLGNELDMMRLNSENAFRVLLLELPLKFGTLDEVEPEAVIQPAVVS